MKPSNREIAEKADIAVSNLVSDGGYLNQTQSNRFIDLVINEPTIFAQCRTVRMPAPQMKIEKIGFADRILRAAPGSGQYMNAADRAKVTTSKIELITSEVMAEVNIPYDVLEDNIEKGNLENTIMGWMAKRTALDLEELLILGDTTSSDTYLALKNGIIASCTSNVLDVTGVDSSMSKSILKRAVLKMPVKYLRNRSALRFFTSPANETEYRDQMADRETGLGDTMLEGFRPCYGYGIPVNPAALVPDTNLILIDPMNVIWGVQRDISVETDKDIRARDYVIVLTMRIDIKFETEDAVVLVKGIGA